MSTKEEFQLILARYREIEQEMEYLEQQKQVLREEIRNFLQESGRTHYFMVVNDEPIALDLKQHTEVRYNEVLLQQRLGARYTRVLKPDLKKIKQHLQDITPVLTPYLDKIGSPSRDVIKELILKGEFDKHDFQGTFEKIQKTILYVRKPPPGSGHDENNPW